MERVWRARVVGPLAPHADGVRAELARLGYTRWSAEHRVWLLGQLSQWLAEKDLELSELSQDRIEQFLAAFGARWKRAPTERALGPILRWLRDRKLVPPPTKARCTPVDHLLERYHAWLVQGRGLAARTIGRYEVTARRFLEARQLAGRRNGVEGLSGVDVTAFLLSECTRLAVGTAKGRVAELRSLLRFLHLEGLTPTALAGAVPPVAGWHDTHLPAATLSISEVQSVLESCDRTRLIGIRDFAILMVLVRLGLRAAEVAGLELADVDWRAGEIVIRSKSRRDDRLPLPADVGEALVAYLTQARPQVDSRRLFLSYMAPLRALQPTAISRIVWAACLRAHVAPVRAHALRHALATELLRQGAALPEISQVLRHRDLATTAIYAKVDWAALRTVARPWPGAQR